MNIIYLAFFSIFFHSVPNLYGYDLKMHIQCSDSMLSISRRFDFLSTTWIGNSKSKYSLNSNFTELRALHQNYFVTLEEIIISNKQVPPDLESLRKRVQELYRGNIGLVDKIEHIAKADNRFILSLVSLEQGLDQLNQEIGRYEETCKLMRSSADIAALLKLLSDYRSLLAEVRSYLAEASHKRTSLLQLGLRNLRLFIISEYKKRSTTMLVEATKQIDEVLEHDRWQADIDQWWFSASMRNGVGSLGLSMYLDYASGMTALNAATSIGKNLTDEISSSSVLAGETKVKLTSELDGYIGFLQKETLNLERGGWKDLYSKQIALTAKRRDANPDSASLCQKSIVEFEKAVILSEDVAIYKQATALYRKQVDSCSGAK